MKKQYAEKIKTMKHEVDKAKAELEETRKALEAAETNEQTEKHKIEAEYKKKLHSVESKLVVLKKKQKVSERGGASAVAFHELLGRMRWEKFLF